MRTVNYEDIKAEIHSKGLTVKLVAAYMHISPATLRKKFNGEVNSDDVQHLNDCIKMVHNDKPRNY
ncbi:MAG: helix-turn-helix transcriptional regulator [Ruminococcus sp.]|uniref:hypothetical protein n=1 Tax=Ruminococcus sp. TaxID=41978 RepID=UPI0025D8AFB8|nr:hypothetical protein [Ruminococcus sp.]MBR6996145.1 helix-turn-helix transcriptional regulator [Ruminococcus sp.]